jgi:hypothetical protein
MLVVHLLAENVSGLGSDGFLDEFEERLGALCCNGNVDLANFIGDLVASYAAALALASDSVAVAGAASEKGTFTDGAVDIGAHGGAIVVTAACDFEAVTGEAEGTAVDDLADDLSLEGSAFLLAEFELNRLSGARVSDDEADACHVQVLTVCLVWNLLGGRFPQS